jgi:hypothetical protein
LIGQYLIPIPGVGFLLGSAVGGFIGGQVGDAIGQSRSAGTTINHITLNTDGRESTLQMAELLRKEQRSYTVNSEQELRARIHADNVAAGLEPF